jgi:hypothetical protein
MVNCCSRVAKRAMRAQKKKRGQSKLFFKIPRTLDWDGSATFERTPGQVLYRVYKGKKLTRLNSWKSKRTKPHYLQTCTGFALSHDFLRTFCGDQLRDASSTLNTVRHLSSLLRRRLHQMTKGLNSAIVWPAPYDRSTWQLALINFQAGLIQAAEFQQLLCLFKWCSTCKSGFGEIPILGSCIAPLITVYTYFYII